jgi:hypothetical protein
MIIQENDFLKTYNEMSNLWEAIEPVVINGVKVNLAKEFQIPSQLIASEPRCTSGIYLIEYNSPTDGFQYYVGKSVDLPYRTNVHFNRHPERDSKLLHNKIAAHYTQEPERFRVAVLEYGSREELCDLEKFWIKTLNTYHATNKLSGLNLTRGGDGGKGATITSEMYNLIVDQLENTERANADIARDPRVKVNVKNVYLINHGLHWLSTGDRAYPIRKVEQSAEYGHRATQNANIAKYEVPHVVCLDRNNNYYYFPNTTKAAEFATLKGIYSQNVTARNKIKPQAISAEDLDDFKNKSKDAFTGRGTSKKQNCWGILKAVPDATLPTGGFTGEEIKNDQGQVVGIKLA